MILINGKNISNKITCGFTLIELIIYCSIFCIFAVFGISSLMYLNSRLALESVASSKNGGEVYKIYFSSYYNRLGIRNAKVDSQNSYLHYLIASTTKMNKLNSQYGLSGINKDLIETDDFYTNQNKINDKKIDINIFDSI